MTLYEFNALQIDARANHLWEHGSFIIATGHPRGRSAFYSLHGYYVEVEMTEGEFAQAVMECRPMQIAAVVPFTKGPRLDRLASVVDLSNL